MFLVKSTKLYLIIVAEILISTILSIFSILIAENDIQRQGCWEMWAENLNEYRCGHFANPVQELFSSINLSTVLLLHVNMLWPLFKLHIVSLPYYSMFTRWVQLYHQALHSFMSPQVTLCHAVQYFWLGAEHGWPQSGHRGRELLTSGPCDTNTPCYTLSSGSCVLEFFIVCFWPGGTQFSES